MKTQELWSAVRKWVPFSVRTMAYATASLVGGPFSSERRLAHDVERAWARAGCRQVGLEVSVTGLENVPAAPFVYCSNHQSVLDIISLRSVLVGDYRWAYKRSIKGIPFLGWHMWVAEHVPVDRGKGPQVAAKATARLEQKLREGHPILVFPEGTRSEDGIVKNFKRGGFIAAVHAGVPVVPVALDGALQLMKKHSIDINEKLPTKITVKVGAPIYPRASLREEAQIDDLRDRTRDTIIRLHNSIGGQNPLPADAPALAAE